MQVDLYNEHTIERAMTFLFKSMESSTNSKPVALHSVRVASILWRNNASETAVVAALLHDLVEDTAVTIEEIERKFSSEVSVIVDACSFDSGDDNYLKKFELAKLSINRSLDLGLNALLVKAADFIDNARYYHKVNDQELRTYLHGKYLYFIEQSNDVLKDNDIWQELISTYDTKVKPLKI